MIGYRRGRPTIDREKFGRHTGNKSVSKNIAGAIGDKYIGDAVDLIKLIDNGLNRRGVAVHNDFDARVCDALGNGGAFAPVFQRELFVEVPS